MTSLSSCYSIGSPCTLRSFQKALLAHQSVQVPSQHLSLHSANLLLERPSRPLSVNNTHVLTLASPLPSITLLVLLFLYVVLFWMGKFLCYWKSFYMQSNSPFQCIRLLYLTNAYSHILLPWQSRYRKVPLSWKMFLFPFILNPSPNPSSDLFYLSIVLPFPECPINGII